MPSSPGQNIPPSLPVAYLAPGVPNPDAWAHEEVYGAIRGELLLAAPVPELITVANAGTTEVLDFTGHPPDVFWKVGLNVATCALSFANVPTVATVTAYLTQDATGNRQVTWPGSVRWASDFEPLLAASPNWVDVIWLNTINGGARWRATPVGQFSS